MTKTANKNYRDLKRMIKTEGREEDQDSGQKRELKQKVKTGSKKEN